MTGRIYWPQNSTQMSPSGLETGPGPIDWPRRRFHAASRQRTESRQRFSRRSRARAERGYVLQMAKRIWQPLQRKPVFQIRPTCRDGSAEPPERHLGHGSRRVLLRICPPKLAQLWPMQTLDERLLRLRKLESVAKIKFVGSLTHNIGPN